MAGEGTLKICLERWRDAKDLGKKPATIKFHSEILAIILACFPNVERPISEISESDVNVFAQKVARYCPSRWNAMVGAIRHVMEQPKLLSYRKIKFRDFKPPGQEEFTALLRECDSAPRSCCGLVVRLLSLTGLRIAEARRLQWSHIGENCIALPGDATKNGRPRSIPLLPGAREVLSRLKGISESQFVMPVIDTRTALRKACQRAGVPQMSYHCFRHIFATKCIESGVDVPTVSRWMGHSDGGALLSRTYYHLTSKHSLEMAEKVRIAI